MGSSTRNVTIERNKTSALSTELFRSAPSFRQRKYTTSVNKPEIQKSISEIVTVNWSDPLSTASLPSVTAMFHLTTAQLKPTVQLNVPFIWLIMYSINIGFHDIHWLVV